MLKSINKGIVLFVVLMTVIMVVILGNIVLRIMFSENRFSHHKVSRIQAYYASLAGLRYASEMMRQYNLNPSGYAAWVPVDSNPGLPTVGTGTNTVCALLCPTSTCNTTSTLASTLCPTPLESVIVDPNLPRQTNAVTIVIGESHSGTNRTRLIQACVDYTVH